MNFRHAILAPLLFPAITLSLRAEAVKDREAAVRQDRANMENDARWIYNDVDRGFAEAKRTAKPLLVVLRCVPCLSCMGIDGQVIENPTLQPLLDQFVCVRVINANAIDLKRFQFDYDLSFSILAFNADGTLYSRYGSWTHQKDPQEKSVAGLQKTLEAVLALHRGYPSNKEFLVGKQAGPSLFATPVEIPELAAKYKTELDWNGKVVQSCVHCHMIGDAHRVYFREKKQPIPIEWIIPMPAPETLGLTLAGDQAAVIASVTPASSAAVAGVVAGDEILTCDNQAIASAADLSWVLHRFPERGGKLSASVRRGGKSVPVTLMLGENWRLKAENTRRTSAWNMRGMVTGGLVLEDLPDEERSALGIKTDGLALRVKFVGQYNKHAAAKNAGFQKDDIIVKLGAYTERLSETALFAKLLQRHFPGESLAATVRRGAKSLELKLPMQ